MTRERILSSETHGVEDEQFNLSLRPTRLERLVVRRGDDLRHFGRRVSGHWPTLTAERASAATLGAAKRLLGNREYERLRGRALALLRRR